MQLSTDDYIEIQRLYARYAWALDMGDLEAYLSTWTKDGEYVGFKEGGPRAKGHEALRALAAGSFANTAERGYHVNANILVEPSASGASGKCYLLRLIASEGAGEIRNALHYDDELVKQNGTWLFRRRNTRAI